MCIKMNIPRDCFLRRSLMMFHAKNFPLITYSCGGMGGGSSLLHISIAYMYTCKKGGGDEDAYKITYVMNEINGWPPNSQIT